MKLALFGYGKMGKAIEEIAVSRGHEIVLKITSANAESLKVADLQKADVAIDFSTPASFFENLLKCFDANIPVVAGTTGWYQKLKDVKELCLKKNQSLLYATNFSIGVNIFFELNKHLAKLMNRHKEYQVEMEEIHHTQKLDSPSGTAITLAETMISELSRKDKWVNNSAASDSEIRIKSIRTENVPGTHTVTYSSSIDTIEIKHIAHNRTGFALGAVIAAEWITGKKGIYQMHDVLNLQ